MSVTAVVQTGAQFGGQVASGNTAGEVSSGGALAGASLLAYLGPAAAAGPVGLAIAGAVAAISMLSGTIAHLIDGCGSGCTQAAAIVNQADTYVQQIAEAYWQAPQRTKSLQTYTLAQLDAVFNKVRTLCGQIPGKPGQDCVQQRLVRGFVPPWCTANGLAVGVNDVVSPNINNVLGRCGGWYDVTYDPIASDPGVEPDPSPVTSVSEAVSNAFPGLGSLTAGGYGPVAFAGLAVLVFVIMKVRGVV